MSKELCINEVCCPVCERHYALFLYPGEIPANDWMCDKCKLKEEGDFLKIGRRVYADCIGGNKSGIIIDSREDKNLFLISFDEGGHNWLDAGWIHPGKELIQKENEVKNV